MKNRGQPSVAEYHKLKFPNSLRRRICALTQLKTREFTGRPVHCGFRIAVALTASLRSSVIDLHAHVWRRVTTL